MLPKVCVACVLMLSVSMQLCSGSAIPIWEFLSRNEKMSHLYSTFAKQVSEYCKANTAPRSTPVTHCKRDLLAFGYERLMAVSDLQLDDLDPYQRDANELLWSTIMRGHPNANQPPRRPLRPAHPHPSTYVILSDKPYQRNPIFDSAEKTPSAYAEDMDAEFMPTTYLSGPHEVRVRPDGTPVEEDRHKPLPQDEDLEAYQFAKTQKAATISSLKQRKLAATALQSQQPRTRRQDVYYQYQQPRSYRRMMY